MALALPSRSRSRCGVLLLLLLLIVLATASSHPPSSDPGDAAAAATAGEQLLIDLKAAAAARLATAFDDAPSPPTPAAVAAADADARGLFHYGVRGPIFPTRLFPAIAAALLPHWEAMRAEALRVQHDMDLFRLHQDFTHPTSLDVLKTACERGNDGWITVGWAQDRDWQNYALTYGGSAMPGKSAELCPRTVELLTSVPGIRLAGFSKLTPNAHIETHTDFTGLDERSVSVHVYLTGHARMRVGTEWVEHVPGNMLVFNTNAPHEVYNGPDERIILYLDLDLDIYFWQTERLDLRNQTPPATWSA